LKLLEVNLASSLKSSLPANKKHKSSQAKLLNKNLHPEHVDSKSNPYICLVDFIAGAFWEKYNRHNKTLSTIIAHKVSNEKVISWPDLKAKWIIKTK